MEKIETFTHILSTWVDYVSLLCSVVLVGGVWIAWRSYKSNLALAKIDKAIQLTEYYKNHILSLYEPLIYIYRRSGILGILEESDNKPRYDFDMNELNKIFSTKQINKLESLSDDDKFNDAATEAYKLFRLDIHVIKRLNDDGKSVIVSKTQIAQEVKSKIINEMLNSLEYFAMFFTQGVADESAIFHSIHQTYFDIVDLLYFQIVKTNENVKNPCDRYFTKTIKLYQTWQDKYKFEKEKHQSVEIEIGNKCN